MPTCSATDIQYSVTNVLPSGYCFWAGANINVTFDVNLWGAQTGYNTAIGYTAANDPILRGISCLDSNADLDSAGCDDYDGTGTASNPFVTTATVNVSCGLPATNYNAQIDTYLNYDLSSGGTNAEVTAPTCQFQTGVSVPYLGSGITITATVINDDGGTSNPGNWTITANIGGGPAEVTGNGFYTGNGYTYAGDYVIDTTGPAGYALDGVSCTNATYNAATSAVTVLPTNTANCVMTFNDIGDEAFLTLDKKVLNDDGGTLTKNDFNISIDGTAVALNTPITVATGNPITISEIDSPDYTEGTWNCVDNAGITTGLPTNGLATNTQLNLEPGSNVWCGIKNDDIAPEQHVDLSMKKSVSDTSPSIGEVIEFTLVVSNAGPDDAIDSLINDILPAGLSYVAGSIAGTATMSDSSPYASGLSWTVAQIPAGSSVSLTYEVTVLPP